MVERTVVIAVVVSVEAIAFLGLLVVLAVIYKFLRPNGALGSEATNEMVTVQERGNSIYRESTYSAGNLSLFGRYSFGRGATQTFTRYQQTHQNNTFKPHQEVQKEPSQPPPEQLELQVVQNQLPDLEQNYLPYEGELQQLPLDNTA